MKEKVLKLVEKCFELIKKSKNFEFSYSKKFLHLTNLEGMENIEKLKLNPLFSKKSQVNSHSYAPLTLSKDKW